MYVDLRRLKFRMFLTFLKKLATPGLGHPILEGGKYNVPIQFKTNLSISNRIFNTYGLFFLFNIIKFYNFTRVYAVVQ